MLDRKDYIGKTAEEFGKPDPDAEYYDNYFKNPDDKKPAVKKDDYVGKTAEEFGKPDPDAEYYDNYFKD